MKLGLDNASVQRKECISEYVPSKVMQEDTISPRYLVIEKIGSGSFGEIKKVYDVFERKLRAVKIEKKDKSGAQGMLLKEAFIMKQMRGCSHFPSLIEEIQKEETQFIVMSLLGKNLEVLKDKNHNKLTPYTTLLIAPQMIEALEQLHSKGFLHRDIKPENFVIGAEGNQHNIFIIDYGLSKKYLDISNKHITCEGNRGLCGTARYTSVNSHKGLEQSRRDDLEALGYVLIYLTKGGLPWQNFQPQEKREEKFKQIKQMKIDISVETLCEDLPSSFMTYMTHVKQLEFEEKPDYEMLKRVFLDDAKKIQKELKIKVESLNCLDWCDQNCSIMKGIAERMKREQTVLEYNSNMKNLKLTQEKIYNHINNENEGVIIPELITTPATDTPTTLMTPKSNKTQLNIINALVDSNKQRDIGFTQSNEFYEDTVEKPSNEFIFQIPFFKPETQIKISKFAQEKEIIINQFNNNFQNDPLMQSFSDSLPIVENNPHHSIDSSQYNNCSK